MSPAFYEHQLLHCQTVSNARCGCPQGEISHTRTKADKGRKADNFCNVLYGRPKAKQKPGKCPTFACLLH